MKKGTKMILWVLVGMLILVVGIILGMFCKNNIEKSNAEYEKAILIEDLSKEMYNKYIFAEGVITATNPVYYEGVEGEYISLEKSFYKKKLTTQTYTSNGETKKRRVRKWKKQGQSEFINVDSFTFCNKENTIDTFPIPNYTFITEIKTDTYEKYKYYGVKNNIKGTLLIELDTDGNVVSENFYVDKTATELQAEKISNPYVSIVLIILMSMAITAFCGYKAYETTYEDFCNIFTKLIESQRLTYPKRQ